ncbi:glycosyltransferase family 2 protein, partial [Campylobacter coli]|nr:glycosyltransferase family 2 protein [Campylobacter coli]
YENKNKEILWQNYQDKVKSNELIKKLSLEFENDKFYKQLFDVLNKEELDLKRRIDNL